MVEIWYQSVQCYELQVETLTHLDLDVMTNVAICLMSNHVHECQASGHKQTACIHHWTPLQKYNTKPYFLQTYSRLKPIL